MEPSILKSVKKALNVAMDDPSFDIELVMYINTAFSVLTDLGVGPQGGFVIEDEAKTWADFLGANVDDEIMLSKVKMAVILRTRQVFDPPASSFVLGAMQETLKETEWRLSVNREESKWVDPTVTESDILVIDGGDPSGE